MNLEELENLIYTEKIELINHSMKNTKARIIQDLNDTFIFIDNAQIENSIEKKCIYAEELRSSFL